MSIHRSDQITIHISSDKMQALLSINAKGPDFPEVRQIAQALADAGVVKGIDSSVLQDIQSKRERVHERVIAKGQTPDSGKDDKIVWKVDIAEKDRPSIAADGKADFKRLNQFKSVRSGEEICSIAPGRASKGGFTVDGTTMEAPTQGEPLVLPMGKNTHLSDDGLILYASTDGVAILKSGLVNVDTVLTIPGDVSFNTGNINYRGTVIIEGDVRSGFRVEATESIYIQGSVEAAEIYSKNGSIHISNGVLGRGRARLLAGDDLICGFLQDATASIKNDVHIQHYAINSHITSGGSVSLIENEGVLRGGTTVAERGIQVLEAGSDKNILTEMILTRSDMGEENSKLWRSKISLAEEYQHLDSLRKRREFLELLQQRLGGISEERTTELDSLRENISEVENQVEKIRSEVEELETESVSQGQDQKVFIRKHLHDKVTVTIGHKKYFSTELKGTVSILRKGDDLHVETASKALGSNHE